MSQSNGEPLPVACNLDVFTPAERAHHEELVSKLRSAVVSSQPLPDGHRLGFSPAAGSLLMLAEFVEAERRCCPFFAFTVRLEPDSAALWLDLTGPDGARELIGEAFGAAS